MPLILCSNIIILGGVLLQVAPDPATLCQGQSGKGQHKNQLDDHFVDLLDDSSKSAIVLLMKMQ